MKSLCVFLFLSLGAVCLGQTETMANRIESRDAEGVLRIDALARDILRIVYRPDRGGSRPTPMMDPKGLRAGRSIGNVDGDELWTGSARVRVCPGTAQIHAGDCHLEVEVRGNQISLRHASSENLYGIRSYGLNMRDEKAPFPRKNGLLRNEGGPVAAGAQGDGGAPLAYTTRWGLLVDSIDGQFTNDKGVLQFSKGSRRDIEAYVILGEPKRIMEAVTQLTGKHPLPPKWSLGFINSQWGVDQTATKLIVDTYHEKNIPLDVFIFDFDFKAWGEDNYGEWRWNSTSGPGAVNPNLFPDGASGKFAADMKAKGVHLMGIMKPRILTTNSDGNPTRAAAEATAKGYWMKKKPYTDYFSHRLANDIDFNKPAARDWYWQHSRGLFEAGIAGWWNDEADEGFGSLGHFEMQQSLYEGQTSISNKRVFSLNRNFYLGAQRFAYAVWSGDIRTGFVNMADQRMRMLTQIGLCSPYWSMDTGGFFGDPTPENYARWMQFAAVTPVMRVHGSYKKHRQPWIYGPQAERVATEAIRLRYSLLPFFYSLDRDAVETGVSIVRPMHWEFPNDPQVANETGAWMLGEQILVSPVVESGQTGKLVYLPEGKWYDYFSGKAYKGGKQVRLKCDDANWTDLPMFVRGGSIVPTQAVVQHALEPVSELTLNIWADPNRAAKATVYDDDGETLACEKGAYFRQEVVASQKGKLLIVRFSKPSGAYKPSVKSFRIAVRNAEVISATWNGQTVDLGKGIPSGIAGLLKIRLR